MGSSTNPPAKWDMEADIVVVGFGAAGVAAALSAQAGTVPRDLAIGELQAALKKQGAFIREPEST